MNDDQRQEYTFVLKSDLNNYAQLMPDDSSKKQGHHRLITYHPLEV